MAHKIVLLVCVACLACTGIANAQSGNFDDMVLDNGGVGGSTFLSFHADGDASNRFRLFARTAGSSLDFDGPEGSCIGRIHRAAPVDSFSMGEFGFGVGIDGGSEALHVFSDDGSAFDNAIVRVENAQLAIELRTMFELVNNGPSRFELQNTATTETWAFQTNNADGFLINRLGSGGNEMSIRKTGLVTMGPGGVQNFLLDAVGNLTVMGTINPMSDRNMKEDFRDVDEAKVLAQIAELPITTWKYKRDTDPIRHIGPVSQDFHAAFAVGQNERSISVTDASGVALAGIKALTKRVEEKNQRISDLEKQLADMNQRMEKLESSLTR